LFALFFHPEEFSAALEPLAILFIILRNAVPEHLLLRNATTVILAAGIGAILGSGIGVIPVLAFLAAMSIYDYIAVFKTGHMVTLAKAVTKQNLSFTFAMPTPEHQFELGTGDIVLPLAFAVSVLHQYAARMAYPNYWIAPLAILAAAFIGLHFTLHYASKRVGKALPALPLQSVLMIIAYAALWLALG
jgi:presenilin-like A22 family membrane protease